MAAQLECARPHPMAMPDTLLYGGPDDIYRSQLFQQGAIEIQDISSQMISLLARPRPGETWWDACAGEGGKTLHMSDLMENRGLIWATDRASWRLKILARRAARAECFNYRARAWSGSAALPTRTRMDGVLLDAPCSGVGTWHRNPQARWTTTPQDVQELAELQKNLLAHSFRAVKPGGKIIYAVCTLTNAETTAVARYFTENFPVRPWPMRHPIKESDAPRAEQWLEPGRFGGNGMFVAAWTADQA